MPRYDDIRASGRAELGGLIRRLNARQRSELRRAMGSPPSLDNVPPALWEQFRREIEQASAAVILLIFLASFQRFESDAVKLHGKRFEADRRSGFTGRVDAARQRSIAEDFARRRAAELAQDYIDNTRARLEAAPPEELPERLDTALSDERADGVGRTETTGATVQAEGAYAAEVADMTDMVLVAVWRHPASRSKNHPCPVCARLEGLRQNAWPDEFVKGPPAHPNCDCFLEWDLITREEAESLRRV